MKRPLAVSGLALFFTMAIGALIRQPQPIVAVSIAAFVLLCVSLAIEKSRRSAVLPTVFVSVLVGCLLLFCMRLFAVQPALSMQGNARQVVAVAESYPERGSNQNRRYVTAAIRTIDGKSVPGKVRISLPAKETKQCDFALDVEPGDTITFVGTVYEIARGDRGIQRSFFCHRVFLGAYPTRPAALQKGGRVLRYAFLRARHWMLRRLSATLDAKTAGLAASVLIGDKSLLPDGIYTDFKNAGVAHIMAVSGLHLSIWVFFFMEILARDRQRKRVAAAILIGFVLTMMGLVLFSGSIMRAGGMLLIYLVGFLLRRTVDSLNSLGAAVLLLLLCDPFYCMSLGFVLSVLSTLAILVFALPLVQPLERAALQKISIRPLRFCLTAAVTTVFISICAAVVTLPVQCFSFGTVSTVGVLSNLLLLPVTMPLILCSGLYVALAAVPLLGGAVGWLVKLLARYCLWVAHFCASLPGAVWTVPKERAWISLCLTAAALVLLSLLVWLCRRKARKDPLRPW